MVLAIFTETLAPACPCIHDLAQIGQAMHADDV